MTNSHDDQWNMYFAHCKPSQKYATEDLQKLFDIDSAFVEEKIGISERYFLATGEESIDLAQNSATLCMDKASLVASDIDLLIYVTQNPDQILPQASARLAAMLGCKESLAAFDISLGCSGWVYALSVAMGFAQTQHFQNIMIVTCDTYSPRMARDDKSMMAIFGDAGAATILKKSNNGRYRIGKGDFGTDGALGENLKCFGGELNRVDDENISPAIKMNGRAILDFMLTRVPVSVDKCLKLNQIDIDDLQFFAFHQASEYMVRLLGRKMGIPNEKVPLYLRHSGNTVSSSIPILLEEVTNKKSVEAPFLVSGFGVGLSWATNVIIPG